VTLPLLEFDLALPGLKGKSLIGDRGIVLAFVGLVVDAFLTLLFVGTVILHFFPGPVLWAACVLAMVALVVLAWKIGPDLLLPRSALPRVRPLAFFVVGAGLLWVLSFGSAVLMNLHALPVLVCLFVVALGALALMFVMWNVGRSKNALQRIALAAGLVVSLAPTGFIGQLGMGPGIIPVVAYDLVAGAFLLCLWQRYAA
jgi:apolipoprotein N-acyltransferase